jgi:phosphonate transport system substrate-binding protein
MLAGALLAVCGGDDRDVPPLVIGGIPDQDVGALERQFGLLAEYLEAETGLEVRYASSIDYAAIVTAFGRGDVQLALFGGLTGVQAGDADPGARAIAQRPRDAAFHSVFIVRAGLDVARLDDLAGLTFTVGSESSTSGHLMPRFFLREAGIDADADLDGAPGYSGSHDKTWQLVEAGAFQAGALSEAVWEAATSEGRVDTTKVRAFFTTPPYFDYHWRVRGDLDEVYGAGTADRIAEAPLALSADRGEEAAELLALFQTDAFVVTENANYEAIREIAERIRIIRGGGG